MVHRTAWDQARSKTERIRQEVKELEERLEELNEEKQEAVQDIQDTRDEQLRRTLQKMERKMRIEHERDQKGKDEEFELEIRVSKERHQKAIQQHNRRQLDEKDKNRDAPPSKRPKLNPDSESKGDRKETDEDETDIKDGELEDTQAEGNAAAKLEQPQKIGDVDKTKDVLASHERKKELSEPHKKLESETKTEELKVGPFRCACLFYELYYISVCSVAFVEFSFKVG